MSIVPIFSEGYSRAKLFTVYFSWPCELFKNAHACALRDCLGVSRPFVSDTSPKCIDREGLGKVTHNCDVKTTSTCSHVWTHFGEKRRYCCLSLLLLWTVLFATEMKIEGCVSPNRQPPTLPGKELVDPPIPFPRTHPEHAVTGKFQPRQD